MSIVVNGSGTITGISTGGLPDGSVDADTLASNAVTSVKIADDAVVEAKIGASAVVTAAINDDAVTNAKVAANAVDEAQLAAGAVVTGKIEDGTITNADINASAAIAGTKLVMPTGSVLQVVQATLNTAFSTTSTSFVDLTGLSAAITPSNSSNKILCLMALTIGQSTELGKNVEILRDSTSICTTRDYVGANNWEGSTAILMFEDSPSSTSSITYKVRIMVTGAGTLYVNRAGNQSTPLFTSSLILMEIAG